jgi:hypothetical protein
MGESFTKKAKLVGEVRLELKQLQRLASSAGELARVSESDRRPWDAAAAAKYISDLSAGLENLCKRRYVFLSIKSPAGPDSHARILGEFLAAPGLGDSIAPDLAARLKEYLRFRHRFIHGYGFTVSWEMVEGPLRELPETVDVLIAVWNSWLESLSSER